MKKIHIFFAIIVLSFNVIAQNEKKNSRPEVESEPAAKTFTQFNNLGVRAVVKHEDNKLAITYFKKALELKPSCYVCKINLGRSKLRLGKFDESIEIFNELLKLEPGNAEVLASLGEALSNQGKSAESLVVFEKALALGLRDPYMYTNYGIALQNTGKHKKALSYFDRSLKLDSTIAETHGNRGITLFSLGKVKKSLKALKTADKLMPNNPLILNSLGVVYDTLGKQRVARDYYQTAVKLDSSFALAQYNLASNFLQTGDRDKAYRKLNLLKAMDGGLAKDLQDMIWGKFVVNASRRKMK